MKNFNNVIGNRTRNLPALVQCLNQLRHRTTFVMFLVFNIEIWNGRAGLSGCISHSSIYMKIGNKQFEEIQQDATVCRYLFTAKLLYMFRASVAPSIGST